MGKSANLNVLRRRTAASASMPAGIRRSAAAREDAAVGATSNATAGVSVAEMTEKEAEAMFTSPWQLLAAGCGFLFVAFVLSMYMHVGLPNPVSSSAPNPSFSEDRAMQHIAHLSENIGFRPVGSSNLDSAYVYIESEIEKIRPLAMMGCRITVEKHSLSGAVTEDIFHHRQTFAYSNITNLVATISFGKSRDHAAVLFNVHLDTKDASPGAGDDATPVGIALEMMRNLITGERMHNQAIFLFNGAEEAGLMGAHAYVTQTMPNTTLVTFVNLEAAGIRGKEMLFQVGPKGLPFLMDSYGYVPRPQASSVAADVFRLVPSDTDFRIFRDFGNLSGYDLALYAHGYVYHTPRDALDVMVPGTVQHYGENALALGRALLSREHLIHDAHMQDASSERPVVFFDILGWYFFWCSYRTASAISIALLVIAGFVFYLEHFTNAVRRSDPTTVTHVAAFVVATILSLVAGIGAAGAAAWFLRSFLGLPVVWFSSPLLAVFLFGCPALAGIMGVQDAVRAFLVRADSNLTVFATKAEGKAADDNSPNSKGASSVEVTADSVLLGLILEHASQWAGPVFINAVMVILCLFTGMQMLYLFAIGLGFSVALRLLCLLSLVSEYALEGRDLTLQGITSGRAARPVKRDDNQPPREAPLGPISYGDIISLLAMNVFPVSLLCIDTFTHFVELAVPLVGRLGYSVSGDFVIAVLVAVVVFFVVLPYLPTYNRANKMYSLWMLFAAALILLVAPFVQHPYSSETPKRVYAQITNDHHITVGLLDSRFEGAFAPPYVFDPAGHGGHEFGALVPFSFRMQTFTGPLNLEATKADRDAGHAQFDPTILPYARLSSLGDGRYSLRLDKGSGSAWATIAIVVPEGSVRSWTVNSSLPSAGLNQPTYIRHVGARLVEFEFEIESSAPLVLVDVSVMHVEDVRDDVLAQLHESQKPDWAAIIPSRGFTFQLFDSPELLLPTEHILE